MLVQANVEAVLYKICLTQSGLGFFLGTWARKGGGGGGRKRPAAHNFKTIHGIEI